MSGLIRRYGVEKRIRTSINEDTNVKVVEEKVPMSCIQPYGHLGAVLNCS
jgi:hypothetical protein